MTNKIFFTTKQTVGFINKYNNGESVKELSRNVGVNPTVIKRVLLENDVVLRKQKRAIVNHDYFFDISNDPVKAYWLGMLITDGNVDRKHNRLRLNLDGVDIDHLHKIQSVVGGVVFRDSLARTIYCFSCYSEQIISDLINLHGIVPNKTFIVRFPSSIPTVFYKDFIRGVVDGDGSLTIDKRRGYTNLEIASASFEFLEEIKNILFSKFGEGNNKVNKMGDKNCFRLRFSGFKAHRIIEWLYRDAPVYLDRKYEKYLSMRNIIT